MAEDKKYVQEAADIAKLPPIGTPGEWFKDGDSIRAEVVHFPMMNDTSILQGGIHAHQLFVLQDAACDRPEQCAENMRLAECSKMMLAALKECVLYMAGESKFSPTLRLATNAIKAVHDLER